MNEEDWLIHTGVLRERMKARGIKLIDSGNVIRKMREERAKKYTGRKTER
jgi:hypothetical protein